MVPEQVAIDAPSHKFRSFLGRHYSLTQYVEQANKFLVWDAFFSSDGEGDLRPAFPPYQPKGDSVDIYG